MISFFTPAPNDASLGYLAQIFGNMNGVIPSGGDINILSTMFQTFNGTLLAVGALIVVYTTVVGVMMTAHEGEFMKKWNNLWTPIRTVIGIASLVPFPSGYSGLQIIMMWVIVQGIGAADQLWSKAVNYRQSMGDIYAQIGSNASSSSSSKPMSPPTAGLNSAMTNLYAALVCDESARAAAKFTPLVNLDATPNAGHYYCNSQTDPWCQNSSKNIDPSNTTTTTIQFGPSGSCGSLAYCNEASQCASSSTSTDCLACQAQKQALFQTIDTMRSMAANFVQSDYDYQNYYLNGYVMVGQPNPAGPRVPDWVAQYCTSQGIATGLCRGPTLDSSNVRVQGGLPDPLSKEVSADQNAVNVYATDQLVTQLSGGNFISTIINNYTTLITDAVASNEISNNVATGQFANAISTGWIFAGAYYHTIVTVGANQLKAAIPPLTIKVTDPLTSSQTNQNILAQYRSSVNAAALLVQTIGQSTSGSPGSSGSSGSATAPSASSFSNDTHVNATMGTISDGTSGLGSFMVQATEPGPTNPLVQIAMAGYWLLFTAQLVFVAFIGASYVLGLVSGINAFALGNGAFNPMAVASPMLFMLLVPALGALLGFMITMGATLGIYVPLIPYMVFTFGAIGWMTSTIETMVAGPLVALGILAPGGHHEILGKAEPALMLLFYIFLRPSLMVFGVIAAMLLAGVVVEMINAMFWTVMWQIIGTATGSLDTSSTSTTDLNKAAGGGNPLELAFFALAYVSFIISALNKCFAAIHIIPEKVIRWIGGTPESYGEDQSLGEMKHAMEGTAQSAGSGMKQAGKEVQSAKADSKKAAMAKKDASDKANSAALDESKPGFIGPKSKPSE